jgi:hypothetical protein
VGVRKLKVLPEKVVPLPVIKLIKKGYNNIKIRKGDELMKIKIKDWDRLTNTLYIVAMIIIFAIGAHFDLLKY